MSALVRSCALTILGLCSVVPLTAAQEPKAKQADKPKPDKQTPVVELKISPAALPLPLFRYRLHPVAGKLMPGNAAPVYLRLRHELNQEAWDQIGKNAIAWGELSVDSFPVKEARTFVNHWSSRLKQIEMGTRRETCEWAYTLGEQRTDTISILLPDAQSMRQWGRLIMIKARLEMAEGNLDEAVHTVGTGLAFGRHVGDGPFLISNLVGMAICNSMLLQLEELVGRPDAPNLYWALTAIPRPIVPIRKSMEIEQRLAENMIPEMNDVFAAHTPTEWTVLSEKIYSRMRDLTIKLNPEEKNKERVNEWLDSDYASYKKKNLDSFRATLEKTLPKPKESLATMSEDEVVARGVVNQYRVMRDEYFKIAYLPTGDATKRRNESEQAIIEAKKGPMAVFSSIQPAVASAQGAEARLERRINMLRTIEAIRLYASAHDGKLPESLDAIKEVPVPIDSATNAPLPYALEGDTAVLTTPHIGITFPWPTFRITVRK